VAWTDGPAPAGLQRVADVPVYATDSMVRRATSLQLAADARAPMVGLPSALWRQLSLQAGARVLVTQGEGAAVLPAREDATLAAGAVRIAAGHPSTAALGAMFGSVTIEKV
jgi:NADH-quinone oxidoreductase subunit G